MNPNSGFGLGDDSKPIPITFPCVYETIDFVNNWRDKEDEKKDIIPQMADALSTVLCWLMNVEKYEDKKRNKIMLEKLNAMIYVLRPDLQQNRTIEQVASQLGVTKFCLFRHIRTFKETFHINKTSRICPTGRKAMSRAARKAWLRRKSSQTQNPASIPKE